MEKYVVLKKEKENEITLEELNSAPVAQFSKLIFSETLDFIPSKDVVSIISVVKNKLLPGGTLSIQGFDIYEISLGVINGTISTPDFNSIIENRKQLVSIIDMNHLLLQMGFKIISKDIDSTKYLIEVMNGS